MASQPLSIFFLSFNFPRIVLYEKLHALSLFLLFWENNPWRYALQGTQVLKIICRILILNDSFAFKSLKKTENVKLQKN